MLQDLRTLHDKQVPFGQFEYVDVSFPSTANLDTPIPHSLKVTDPESVRWMVVRQSLAGSIYVDDSASRRKWGSDFIVLRSSVGSLKARLLLFTEK